MIRSQSLNQLEKSTFQETAITGFLKTDDSKKLIETFKNEGGFTVLEMNVNAGRYVVGLQGFSVSIVTADSYISKAIDILMQLVSITKDAVGYGVWKDADTIYFDTIYVTDDLEEAKRIGEENGEIAIYDRVEDRAIIL